MAAVLLVCGPPSALGQRLESRDAGVAVTRDLQVELQSLVALARTMRQMTQAANQVPPTEPLLGALDRIRAADLLIDDQQRALEERLQRQGASVAVLQRQRENARLFRERLDRLYQAASPLTPGSGRPLADAAQVGAALDAIVAALADVGDQSERTPIGAILPYRSLALPQVPPRFGATITPAYLTSPVAAPLAADLADASDTAFSPAIRAKAIALAQDPIAIFEFVQNDVRSEFYYGAMKDAAETLRQLSGNDTDQASLLIALLRASRVPARYVRGVIRLTGPQAVSWTGATSTRRAAEILTRAGIPFRPILQGGAIGAFEIEHTWVEAYVAYSNYRGVRLGSIGQAWIPLDPSFKGIDVTPGVDLLAAMGFRADTLVPEYLSATQALSPMEFYRQKFTDYLAQNRPDLTFEQVIATSSTRAVRSGLLPSTLPYAVVSANEESAVLAEVLRHRVRFVVEGEGGVSFDVTVSAAELAGRRLTLSYVPATVEDQVTAHAFLGLDNTPAYLVKLRPVLKVGGIVKGAGATAVQMGAMHSFTVEIQTPRGVVPIVNSVLAGGYYAVGLASQPAPYEIPLARAPDDTEHPAADRLYSLAIDYISRWNEAEHTLERILRIVNVRPSLSHVMVGTVHARTVLFGQPQSIEWRGVFVDADLRVAEPVPTGADDGRGQEFMRLSGLAGSALEADVLQLNLHVDAVSASKVIQLARAGGLPIEEVDATNLAEVLARLQTAPVVRTEIADAVNQGWRVTIPRADLTRNIWTGIGYLMVDPATGAGGYFISGGLAGGISVLPPEDWPDQPLAEELGSPNAEPPNTDPTSVRFLTKVAITDKQNGTVDQPLGTMLAVWARDENGRPVEGATVTFEAADGHFNGAVTFTITTDYHGIAKAPFTLGTTTSGFPFHLRANPGDQHTTQVGQNLVNAYATAGQETTVILPAPFQHFAYPGPSHHIAKVAGDGNRVVAGTSGGTVLARLEDEHGNPISNASLMFDVLPAAATSGQLPPTAANMVIYPQDPRCATTTPVLGDCNADSQELVTTSSSGAAVETILGNTQSTRYQVAVRAVAAPAIQPEVFTLESEGDRTFGTGSYEPPSLHMTLSNLFNDRGQFVNSGPVGALLAQSLEVAVFMVEDNYTLVTTGAPCTGEPNDPPCWRFESLETKRIRPIGQNVTGEISFPRGGGNPDVIVQRVAETANVAFTAVAGGGTSAPTETPAPGRYTSRLVLGPEPALNLVHTDVTATVWVPCFDLHSGQFPMEPKLATTKAGQLFLNQLACTGSGVPQFFQGNWTVLEHAAVGVRATVQDTAVPVTEDGIAIQTDGFSPPPFLIPYLIEPLAYSAATADLDLFRTDQNGVDTWLGYLPTTSPGGSGSGVLLQGTAFDITKPHRSQLVLNRGTSLEIRSEKAPLQLVAPSQLVASPGVTLRTYLDRVNQAVCPVPGQELAFYLSRDARVTIRVDGNVLQGTDPTGPVVYDNLLLERGLHSVAISPSVVPAPGLHAFHIAALFPQIGGQPDIERTADGPIVHEVIINATLPVGHSLVQGVDLFDGHFSLARDDLSVLGHGPTLMFNRSYSTAGFRSSGPMGAGWTHNFESRVILDACGTLTLMGGAGSGMRFDSPVSQGGITTFTPQAGYHGSLTSTNADGSYDFYTVQRLRHHYERFLKPGDAIDPVVNRLAFIEDSNGNRLTLTYEASPPFNLTTVTDASGRSLTLTYQPFGLVPEPRIVSVAGPLGLLVTFEYDERGNLMSATRGPRTERYEYRSGPLDPHNIVRILGPNNGVNPAADVTELTYFTGADPIPGQGTNTAETWEIVKTITAGAGTPQAATHEYTYDLSAQITTVTDPRDVSTVYTMHAQFGAVLEKRVLLATGDNVTTTRWAFQDGVNDVLMTRTTDPNGRVITYAYDAKGNPTTTTIETGTVPYAGVSRADGTSVNAVTTVDTFDPVFGRLVRSVDAEGRSTDYAIDPNNGNVLSMTTHPGGGAAPIVTQYSYTTVGSLRGVLKTTTDPRGGTATNEEFDAFGNPTKIVDPVGNVTTNVYDERGRVRQSHDTFGHHTAYEYDELDRPIHVTDSTFSQPSDIEMASTADRGTATTYLPGGQPRTLTDGNHHVTEFAYDALNRQVLQRDQVQNADGDTETLEIIRVFDPNGNKTYEKDRRGIEHTFDFDPLNRLTQARISGQVVGTSTYDDAGNRLTETDLHGHQTRYEFDAMYRRVRTVLPLAPYATTATYDLVGNVLRETDANGQAGISTFDGVNRLTMTTDPVGVTKRFEYDAAGNRTLEEDQTTGLRTRTDFDGLNRPILIRQEFTDPLSGQPTVYTTQITHRDAEYTKVTTSPRGVVARERFNGHDALIERVLDAGDEMSCTPASGGPVCLQTTYRFDGNGNPTGQKDSVGGVVDKAFAYDGLNRRILATYPLGGQDRWFYDGNDNVVRTIDSRGIESRSEYDSLDRPVRQVLVESISNGGQDLQLSETIYDDAGNTARTRDANGNSTRQDFDALHRPTRRVDALNQASSTEWDGVYKVAEVDDVRGLRTEFLNDAIGRVLERRRLTDSGSVVERTEYVDGQSRRTETDPNGVTTTIVQQDPLQRTRRVSQRAAGLAAAYGAAEITIDEREYDGHGKVTRAVDANGNVTAFAYDGGDRQVRVTVGVGTAIEASTTFTYDRADNLLTTKDARPHDRPFDARFTYDVRNRKVLAEDGAGNVTAYFYDEGDNLVVITEPGGGLHRTGYVYGELNEVLTIDDTRGGVGGVTRYSYDANRNRTAQQDASGNLTTYRYDALNHMTDMLQHAVAGALADGSMRSGGPGGDETSARRWQYAYDSTGNETRITDAAGQQVDKTYDKLDRLVRRTYQNHQPDSSGDPVFPRPTTIVYSYDANGNQLRVDETKELGPGQAVTETSTMQYDPLNRRVLQTNYDGKTVRFEYDRAGNQKAVIDADGTRTDYAFDARNRPTAATEGVLTTQFTYWPDDLTRAVIHPGGVVSETSYDAADRVLRIVNSGAAGPISDYDYTYDPNGNRLTQTERHTRLYGGASQRRTYQYDAANRLASVGFANTAGLTYSYAPNGNRLTETGTTPEAESAVARSYVYDRFNQLKTIADAANPGASIALRYDRNGNTTEQRTGGIDPSSGDVPAPTAVRTLAWNIRDYLARSDGATGPVTFDYDFAGRRVKMNAPTFGIRYLHDAAGVIQEYDGGSLATTLRYSRGPGGLLAMSTGGSGGARYSFLTDALGSTSELTDASGATQASYAYDPFGKVLQHFDLTPNRRTFSGHYRDTETGLFYMGARYYDEGTGRFLSQDPFQGDALVPASLNRYTYAHNNPVLFVDPDGRAINLVTAGAGFLIGGAVGCIYGASSGVGCGKGALVGAAAGGLAGLTFGVSMWATGGMALLSGGAAGGVGGYVAYGGDVLAHDGSLQEAHKRGKVGGLLGFVGGATAGVFIEAGVGLYGMEMVVTEATAAFAESTASQLAGIATGEQDSYSFRQAVFSAGMGAMSPLQNKLIAPVARYADRAGIAADLMMRPRILSKTETGPVTWKGAWAFAGTCDFGCANLGGLGPRSLAALRDNVSATRRGLPTAPTGGLKRAPENLLFAAFGLDYNWNQPIKHSQDLDWAVYDPNRPSYVDPAAGRALNDRVGSHVIDDIHGVLGEHVPWSLIPPKYRSQVLQEYGGQIRAVDYWERGIDLGGGKRKAVLSKGGRVIERNLDPNVFEFNRKTPSQFAFRGFWMQLPRDGRETEK